MILVCASSQIYASNPADRGSLQGTIKDKQTGELIPGATIYLPDLQKGTTSDADGKYSLTSLPKTKVMVQVSFLGYKTIVETIDLSKTTERNFSLETTVTELNEVVVTGQSGATEATKIPVPMAIVNSQMLLQTSSTNIIDAIALQPGVSQITTGSGISKPVIRGLGYNRVVVVDDGVRQEGQQWGDEHGIEIDESSVDKVEILKGPASLSYGSDAMAGVVNMLSAPPPMDGKTIGQLATNYQTNNGLFGISANVAGNQHGFIWNVRLSDKLAHDYKNSYDGFVQNSGYREDAADAMIGLNKHWGYSKVTFSIYNFTPGIIDGSRDSVTGKFTKQVAVNGIATTEIVPTSDFKRYTPQNEYQKIRHDKLVFDNSFFIKGGTLKAIVGLQQNSREEFGNVLQPDQFGLGLLLNTISYDIRYNVHEFHGFTISVGANGMEQSSLNKGIEYLVPDYNLFDIGCFVIAKKSIGAVDISGGIRYDNRDESGKSLFLDSTGKANPLSQFNTVQRFKAFTSNFSGTSGSIGATWQISEDFYTKANISKGFRAPNIGELGSNGVHDGTSRYEIGNPILKQEQSLQFDYALGLRSKHVVAEIDLFDNNINNYIFPVKLRSALGRDSLTDGNSSYKYVSGDAQLFGGELSIDIHPHPFDWLHFENSFSYVNAIQKQQPDSTKYLPFTPPAKLQDGIKFDIKQLSTYLSNSYVRMDVDNYFNQTHYYAATATETRTNGYTLLNFGIGSDVMRKQKSLCSIYISLNNATNRAYQSHLSRLKYLDENYATGRVGVYNMGRNLSFKVVVPLHFNKT